MKKRSKQGLLMRMKEELPAATQWINQGGYKNLLNRLPEGLVAYFPLTDRSIA